MGLFSKKGERKAAQGEAAKQGYLAYKALEGVDSAKAATQSAEEARLGVYGMLGAPGTYDLPGTQAASGGVSGLLPGTDIKGVSDIYDYTSSRAQQNKANQQILEHTDRLTKETRDSLTDPRTGIIDPKKYAEFVSKSAGFRIQSRLVAESEQLLAQEGPAWDRLYNSTIGQVVEGAGMALREELRTLKDQAAKGGNARRTALTQANELLVRENNARSRINETWNANLRLFDVVHQTAQNAAEGTTKFLDNLPVLRETYNSTMNNLAKAMVAATQVASTMSASGYQAMASVGTNQLGEKLILGVASIALSAVGGAAGSAVGGATGSAISTASSQLGQAGMEIAGSYGTAPIGASGSAGYGGAGGYGYNPNEQTGSIRAGDFNQGTASTILNYGGQLLSGILTGKANRPTNVNPSYDQTARNIAQYGNMVSRGNFAGSSYGNYANASSASYLLNTGADPEAVMAAYRR